MEATRFCGFPDRFPWSAIEPVPRRNVHWVVGHLLVA